MASVAGEVSKSRYVQYEPELIRIISENLKQLCKMAKWTQRDFAEAIEYAPAQANAYYNGNTLISTKALFMLSTSEELRRKGIKFSVDDLMKPGFEPGGSDSGGNAPHSIINADHRHFVGTYFLYLFDQTETEVSGGPRSLRYGVLNIREIYVPSEPESYIATARFFKEEDKWKAEKIKNALDSGVEKGLSRPELTDLIRKEMYENNEQYPGTVTFSEKNVFISISNIQYYDQALVILPLKITPKTDDRTYIGGLGSVNSVTRGDEKMPAAQKIIISRYKLEKSVEEIGKYLRLSTSGFKAGNETAELVRWFERLYSVGDKQDDTSRMLQVLQDNDRKVLFESRMQRLIKEYIEKNAFCVGVVSGKDDHDVYKLIKQFRK